MPKILVLEDQLAVAELIKLKLERGGFEVAVGADGMEGLEIIKKFKPDLIVLDVLMPNMDGYQFYKRIKAGEKTSRIPILVMTIRGAMKDAFEGLGADSFLPKPFEPDKLLEQVKKLLAALPEPAQEKPVKKALIVGSDSKKIEDMQRQLEKRGFTVEASFEGKGVLAKLLKVLPQLFFLEMDMPEINAEEFVEQLKAHPEGKKVSVVVFSHLKSEENVRRSSWGKFLDAERKKDIHAKEAPLKIIDKFDANSFLDKIKDFL